MDTLFGRTRRLHREKKSSFLFFLFSRDLFCQLTIKGTPTFSRKPSFKYNGTLHENRKKRE